MLKAFEYDNITYARGVKITVEIGRAAVAAKVIKQKDLQESGGLKGGSKVNSTVSMVLS